MSAYGKKYFGATVHHVEIYYIDPLRKLNTHIEVFVDSVPQENIFTLWSFGAGAG